jgi:hypothetical protein
VEVPTESDDDAMEDNEAQKTIKRVLSLTAATAPTKPNNFAIERMKLLESKKQTTKLREKKRKANAIAKRTPRCKRRKY